MWIEAVKQMCIDTNNRKRDEFRIREQGEESLID